MMDRRDAWHGCENHAARFEDPLECRNGRLQVVYALQYLRNNNAVESPGRQVVGAGKVANERRIGVARLDVEHVAACHTSTTKVLGIATVIAFKHTTANVARMALEEIFYVVAVDRYPTGAPSWADRSKATETPEPDEPTRREN